MKIKCCGKDLGDLAVKEGRYISGKVAFHLYDTHGIPIEITEIAINLKLKEA